MLRKPWAIIGLCLLLITVLSIAYSVRTQAVEDPWWNVPGLVPLHFFVTGFWTAHRRDTDAEAPALAGVKTMVLGVTPVVILGVLVLGGILPVAGPHSAAQKLEFSTRALHLSTDLAMEPTTFGLLLIFLPVFYLIPTAVTAAFGGFFADQRSEEIET